MKYLCKVCSGVKVFFFCVVFCFFFFFLDCGCVYVSVHVDGFSEEVVTHSHMLTFHYHHIHSQKYTLQT